MSRKQAGQGLSSKTQGGMPFPGVRGVATAFALLGVVLTSACAGSPVRTEAVFYPAAPEEPRIQYLTTISTQEDVRPTGAFRRFVIGKPNSPALGRPWALAHDQGSLYVVDKALGQVVVVDLEERRFGVFPPVTPGGLMEPGGIFVAADGFKYLADAGRGQVLEFDADNQFVRALGSRDQFRPLDVVVHGDRIYVCDVRDEEIEVLDRETGEVVGRIGRQGDGPGTFRFPTHLTLGRDGDLYVTDMMNFRVQQFDAEGKYVRELGGWGDYPGAMPRPKGISVDRAGHLYEADAAFEMIQVFDVETGQTLMPFGKYGSGPGMSYLPSDIDIDYDNLDRFARYVAPGFTPEYLIYVTNQAGPDKVNVYAFGQWQEVASAGPGKDEEAR